LTMSISTSVTSHTMTTIEAESVVLSTTQCNLAIREFICPEPLPLSDATTVTQDSAVVIFISTIPVVSQRSETKLIVTYVEYLIFLPVSNAIAVAAPVVVLLCAPAIVASSSYTNDGVLFRTIWPNSLTIAIAYAFDVKLFLAMTITIAVTADSVTVIHAISVVPSTTQCNQATSGLNDTEFLPLTNATTVTQDTVVVILISTVPVVSQ